MHDHINALNRLAKMVAESGGLRLSPFAEDLKRLERQAKRIDARAKRHASWPYCGKQHRERINRQVAAGSLRVENGLVLQ